MKIILSRKGFDSANGGCASPIMPDGTLISMPIPEEQDRDATCRYSDLSFGEVQYDELWRSLGKKRYIPDCFCHLDPDIRPLGVCDGWKPAFGQCGGSETHLRNQGVKEGDLFLFFGWFRQVERNPTGRTTWRYVKGSPNIQAIYGYLQIGEIIRGDEIRERCPWHPHASPLHQSTVGNTLYLPTKELTFDAAVRGMPGCGTFKYAEDLRLTKIGLSRSKWEAQEWMKTCSISHHSEESLHDEYFQSVPIGQEFVVEENPAPLAWAASLLSNHKTDPTEK